MRSRRLTGRQTTYLEAIVETAATLEEAGFPYTTGAVRPDSGVVLAYTPPARANAIQSLLYRGAWAQGVAPLPVRDTSGLRDLPWTGPMVCHLHWIADVLRGAGPDEAGDRIADFADLLDDLREQGRKLLWTVHNFLPHDSAMPDRDRQLREVLIERLDAIHLMAKSTFDVFAERGLPLPEEKCFYTPHPSYAGAYPDIVTTQDARGELGVGRDDFAFVLFGAIARYKGVTELMTAFDELREESSRPVKLILAGAPADEELEAEIRYWAQGRKDVVTELRRIANDDVQYFLRAADAAVFPYREVLNSGSAVLALSFGLPIVVPRIGAFVELVTEYVGTSFDREDPDGLRDAMAQALELDAASARRRISTRIDATDPRIVSEKFFGGLFETLGWPRGAARPEAEEVRA